MSKLRPIVALSFLALPLAASILLVAAHRQSLRRQKSYLQDVRRVENNGHLRNDNDRVVLARTRHPRSRRNPPSH